MRTTTCPRFSTVRARTPSQRTASVRATSSQRCARWSIPRTQKTSNKSTHFKTSSKSSQKDIGKFEVPNWDHASQKKVRDALLVLNTTISDFKNGFGARGKVDPIMHLIGTASGWGGNPDKDATYAMVTPAKNDGTTVYKLNVKNVPVDGFWSVSVYNEGGYFEKNPQNAYSLNSITAQKEADGSIAIQFGGCDGKIPNCLPIMKGWNAATRMYRPRPEILSRKWKFPEAAARELREKVMQLNNAVKLASLALALSICLANAQTSEVARYPIVNYTDASPHKSTFARVNGVNLNYLDWAAMDRPLF